MLYQIIALTLVGSLLSLCGGFLLLLSKSWGQRFSLLLTSFAAGVLLTTAFLDLLPEAVEHANGLSTNVIFSSAFAGILIFFVFERSLLWFHHHHGAHDVKPTVWMVTLGDGLHNFIDGVAIASTYIINPALGITTTLAVAAHEIPQEIADFSILITSGLPKSKAILFNVGASITALIGAVGTYYFSSLIKPFLPQVIAFAAGMFMYIALSDLIPELHKNEARKDMISQLVAFIFGFAIVLLSQRILKVI